MEVKEEAKVEAPATNLFNEPVQAEEKPKAKAAKAAKGDDLKIIEGIGPKIAELLHAEGVVTFKDLAVTPLEKLKEVLEAAGSRYRMHDPTTWPEQANLAAEGRMDELKTLQDSLKGGKVE